jgi:hypothetical protein
MVDLIIMACYWNKIRSVFIYIVGCSGYLVNVFFQVWIKSNNWSMRSLCTCQQTYLNEMRIWSFYFRVKNSSKGHTKRVSEFSTSLWDVGIATGYGHDDRGVGVTSPGRVRNFLHVVQTGSGVHPASCQRGTGGFSPGVKRPGREGDHSPQTSAEVNKMWIYTSTPPYAFMA